MKLFLDENMINFSFKIKPIEVYKITGTKEGDRYFDIKTWKTGYGGTWLYYYVDRGFFSTY
jgi:hypothetical protein